MKSQLTIIGTNHGTGTSRICLEGKRLVEAGFKVGACYDITILKADKSSPRLKKLGLRIALVLNTTGKFKVSGKGNNPTIDISGKAVTETFREPIEMYLPRAVVIQAEYSKGKIVLKSAGCR